MTAHLRAQWRAASTNPVEFLPTVGVTEGQRLYRGQHINTTNHDRGYPRGTPHGLFLKQLQESLSATLDRYGILAQIDQNWSTDPDAARKFGNPGGDPYHEWIIVEMEGWTWGDLPDQWSDPSALDMRPWSDEHEVRFKPGWHPRADQIKAITVLRDAYDSGLRVTALRTSRMGPLYHGTTEANAEQILFDGFMANPARKNVIYLTEDPELAQTYAEAACKKPEGGTPAVLKVDHIEGVSAMEVGYMDPDLARQAGADFSPGYSEVLVLNPECIHGPITKVFP